MEECVRMMQQNLRSAPSIKKRAKSVYSQRNLGTIKERKKEKSREQETSSEQTIMRILRMRFVFLLFFSAAKRYGIDSFAPDHGRRISSRNSYKL